MSTHHTHTQTHHDNASHGSLKSYLAGFALSLILTLLSFGCVMTGLLPHDMVKPGLLVFCVAQVLVQLVFFLHLSFAPAQRNNTLIGLFALLLIAIVVAGSLWVLHNMNVNMMPHMQGMSM